MPLWHAISIFCGVSLCYFSADIVAGNILMPGFLLELEPFTRGSGETPRQSFSYDVVRQFIPYLKEAHIKLWSGEMPLWSHNIGLGGPLLGIAQGGYFFPLNWLYLIFGAPWTFTVIGVAKLALASLGMYVLLSKLDLRFTVAIIGGVVYAYAGPLVAWLNWPISNVLVVLPFATASLINLRLSTKCLLRSGGLAAICIWLLVVSGHPGVTVLGLLFLGLFLFFQMSLIESSAGRRQYMLNSVCVFMIGVGCAAVYWVPVMEALMHSEAIGRLRGYNTQLDLKLLALTVFPDLPGNLSYLNTWFTPTPASPEIASGYIGVTFFLSAVLALIVANDRKLWGFAVLGVLFFVMSYQIPFLTNVTSSIPIISGVGIHRSQLIWSFILVIIGAHFIDKKIIRRVGESVLSDRRVRWTIIIFFVLSTAMFFWTAGEFYNKSDYKEIYFQYLVVVYLLFPCQFFPRSFIIGESNADQ